MAVQCFSRWRAWIRPFSMALYVMILIIVLPFMIVELNKFEAEWKVKGWFIGGLFVLLSLPISLWSILQHLVYYSQPQLQRHIIRILWMVPFYGLNAWLALRFKDSAIYLDTLRECYEAYVVYNFMAYLRTFLLTDYDLEATLEMKPQVQHLWPLNYFLPVWRNGKDFILNCKHGVLQYTVVRPLTTSIAFVCEWLKVYDEGNFSAKGAWTYLVFVDNISQIFALYCLALFYKACKEELAPIQPLGKFLCIKAVIFATFWQSFFLQILVAAGVIPDKPGEFLYDASSIAAGLQDFLICIEMFFAAIAHYYAFSHKPFVDLASVPLPCCEAFLSMWNVSDVKDDVFEHVRVVGGTVKRRIGRSNTNINERTALLESDSCERTEQTFPIDSDFYFNRHDSTHHLSSSPITEVMTASSLAVNNDLISSGDEPPEDLSSHFTSGAQPCGKM